MWIYQSLLELIPQAKNANKESIISEKELNELREELKETSDGKKHLNNINMALTNEVKKLRDELAKKGKRTEKGKEEHTKLQSEAKLLGKTVKRYEDNIAELKATIAKQENKLNQKDVNPSNDNLLDNGNGKGNEGLSEVVVTKDLLKSIDEILQSKLVALEERLKGTMTNEIGKNKQNIEAVIKENKYNICRSHKWQSPHRKSREN